jgi:ADP-dependent NAD(P)H-hydrate dehydratase / NAD(P)H-hydrate epimerase
LDHFKQVGSFGYFVILSKANSTIKEREMLPVYNEVDTLDQRALHKYYMSEDILMEHAALALYKEIVSHETKGNVFILCGPGNNGADGVVLARLLRLHKIEVSYYLPLGCKSEMANIQLKRNMALGINPIAEIEDADFIVDAFFGSGLHTILDGKAKELIKSLNALHGYKIACDVPSGLLKSGEHGIVFKADTIVTMGAIKISLLHDHIKILYKKMVVANLGLPQESYTSQSDCHLLEEKDLVLPYRSVANVHKGNYGHVSILVGEMQGAATISAVASLHFGAGLTTMVSEEKLSIIEYGLMQSRVIPEKSRAIALGMGLGRSYHFNEEQMNHLLNSSLVIDADMFYHESILDFLNLKELVLTPHPKEFVALLSKLAIVDITVEQLQKDRFKYVKQFSQKFPHVCLILKGANTIIAYERGLYVVNFGWASLAKGGSGDVLAGMVVALLAQGYSALESAKIAVMAHAKASQMIRVNDYALTPTELIKSVASL